MKSHPPKRTTLPFPGIVGRRYMKGGFKSGMLGCHRTQVDFFNSEMKRHGCDTGVKYDNDGTCHVSDENDYDKVINGGGVDLSPSAHPVDDD